MLRRQAFFWRTLPDGRREVSWRVWVLVWLLPVLFLAAAAILAGIEAWRLQASLPAEGEVVRVYAWEGETVFDRGLTNYAPVFRYVWSDGHDTEASAGMSHPDWNFAIGSRHAIRYFPRVKTDVMIPGRHNWMPALVIFAIGAVLVPPALALTLVLRRWLRGGRTT